MQALVHSGVGLLALSMLSGAAAALAGCSTNSPALDVGREASVDTAPPDTAVPDQRTTDLPPNPDILPGYVECGGSRTIVPKAAAKGTSTPCGVGCEQLTFTGDVSMNFDVKGDLLVWSEGGNGVDIYYVDLKTRKGYLVHDADYSEHYCDRVATDGMVLGFSCTYKIGDGRYLQSLKSIAPSTAIEKDLLCQMRSWGTCRPSTIAMGSTGVAINIGFYKCSLSDVHFYRHADTSFTNLSNLPGRSNMGHMSGTRLVWGDWPKGSYMRTVLYDTVAKTKTPLAPGPGFQYMARIEGDRVVWMDSRNDPKADYAKIGNADIFYHDLSSGKTSAVTTHPATQENPDIEGDWVVWTDWRNAKNPVPVTSGDFDNGDIYAKNLKTGKVYQVTDFKHNELYPKVEGGKVYFRARSKQGLDIFVIDLKKRLGV